MAARTTRWSSPTPCCGSWQRRRRSPWRRWSGRLTVCQRRRSTSTALTASWRSPPSTASCSPVSAEDWLNLPWRTRLTGAALVDLVWPCWKFDFNLVCSCLVMYTCRETEPGHAGSLILTLCVPVLLPWYNCTGWLGVKHQITYLRSCLVMYTCREKAWPCWKFDYNLACSCFVMYTFREIEPGDAWKFDFKPCMCLSCNIYLQRNVWESVAMLGRLILTPRVPVL